MTDEEQIGTTNLAKIDIVVRILNSLQFGFDSVITKEGRDAITSTLDQWKNRLDHEITPHDENGRRIR